jgi:hypothetical protein
VVCFGQSERCPEFEGPRSEAVTLCNYLSSRQLIFCTLTPFPRVEKIRTSTDSKWEKKGFGTSKQSVDRGTELTFMYVGFTTKEGKVMEVKTLATFHTEAKVGDTHPMIYLPWRPERAKIYSVQQLWLPMIVGFGFVTVTLLVGVRCLSRGSFFPRVG